MNCDCPVNDKYFSIKCNLCKEYHSPNCSDPEETILGALSSKEWYCKLCKIRASSQQLKLNEVQSEPEPSTSNEEIGKEIEEENIDINQEIDLEFWKEVLIELKKEDEEEFKAIEEVQKLKLREKQEGKSSEEKEAQLEESSSEESETVTQEEKGAALVAEEDSDKEWLVDDIIDYNSKEDTFLIKWTGFSKKENTWEPRKNLTRCCKLLQQFKQRRDLRKRLSRKVKKKSYQF